MDDYEYEHALKQAVLAVLGINEPPFVMTVNAGVGDVAIELRDPRAEPRDPSGGKFVANALVGGDLTDGNIPNTAREAAEQMRGGLEQHIAANGNRKMPNSGRRH
jgi:hypothetical protein